MRNRRDYIRRPMTDQRLRLLSLTNAFPPGVIGRFPQWCFHASHATETRMAQALARHAQISTVGLLAGNMWGKCQSQDDSLGLQHDLVLWERKPELWHRWNSCRQLRRFYLERVAREGMPDAVLVRNLTAVFNVFVRWLRQQKTRPLIVLVLADTVSLGQPVPAARRLRYLFKPMQTLENEAALWYDACIAFGTGTRSFFEARGTPWMWMPSAFNFDFELPTPPKPEQGPIRFGYFGGLSNESAVLPMVRGFLAAAIPGTLHVCGYGNLSDEMRTLAARHPNIHFDGLLPKQVDCLAWAQKVDVLINPRLPFWENSFPSKVFEFAITGKAILSTRIGGVDEVLLHEGLYFDAANLEDSLREALTRVAKMDRADLQRRGMAIRDRVLREYNWDAQAQRIIEFIRGVIKPGRL